MQLLTPAAPPLPAGRVAVTALAAAAALNAVVTALRFPTNALWLLVSCAALAVIALLLGLLWWSSVKVRFLPAMLALALLLLALINLVSGQPLGQFLLTLSLAGAATLALRRAGADGLPLVRWRGWWTVGLALAAGAVVGLRLYGLAAYPPLNIRDEPWTWSWALSWMRTGQPSDLLMLGYGDAYYAFPRFFLPMAWWMQAFGLGIWQGRLYIGLFSIATVACTALAAANWYGRRVGWLTAWLLFASVLLAGAGQIRHDIGLAFAVALSLWLHTVAIRRNHPAFHFVAGLAIGLGMFAHYHASGLGAVLLVSLYGPRWLDQRRQRLWPEKGVWLYGLGGLAGAAVVYVLQILVDNPAGFATVLQTQNKYSNDAGQAIVGALYHVAYLARSPLELALIAAGTVVAARRGSQADRALVWLIVLGHLVLGIMASPAIYYYTVPLIPVYAIVIATFVASAAGALPLDRVRAPVNVSLVALLFGVPLLATTIRVPLERALTGAPMELAAPPPAAWIQANVPHGAIVAGAPTYFFWLTDYQYAADHIPEYAYPQYQNLSVPGMWALVSPDVFIVEYSLDSFHYFEPLLQSGFLETQGYQRVAHFDSPVEVDIYRRPVETEIP